MKNKILISIFIGSILFLLLSIQYKKEPFPLTKEGIVSYYYYLTADYKNDLKNLEKKYDLEIRYKVNRYFLPELWRKPPYNTIATQLSDFEISRFAPALKEALSRYPTNLIKKNLQGIFLTKRLRILNKYFGGTFTEEIVYLTTQTLQNEDNFLFLIYTFHHEFSSILRLNYNFNNDKWNSLLPKRFKYLNNLSALGNPLYSLNGNKNLYKAGFVSGYSRRSLDDDISEYSAVILGQPKRFKALMEKYPLIRKKFEVWLEFYQSIDPIFTEEYLFGES